MSKQIPTAALILCLSAGAYADTLDLVVDADTYIRNDAGGPNSKNDTDPDNEVIVGINGSASAELNGLLRFDLSDLLVLGSPGDITLNSVTLTGVRGAARGNIDGSSMSICDRLGAGRGAMGALSIESPPGPAPRMTGSVGFACWGDGSCATGAVRRT